MEIEWRFDGQAILCQFGGPCWNVASEFEENPVLTLGGERGTAREDRNWRAFSDPHLDRLPRFVIRLIQLHKLQGCGTLLAVI